MRFILYVYIYAYTIFEFEKIREQVIFFALLSDMSAKEGYGSILNAKEPEKLPSKKCLNRKLIF